MGSLLGRLALAAAVAAGCAPARTAAALPADATFRPWFTSGGVEVRQSPEPDSWPWVQAVARLDAPPDRVRDLVVDFARYPAVFAPYVGAVEILERHADGATLRMVWRLPFPFRDRVALIRYAVEPLPSGGWTIRWRDAGPAPAGDEVRVGFLEGAARIEADAGGRARVTYTGRVDLRLGAWLNEQAARHQPLTYFAALRTAAAQAEGVGAGL